MARCEGDGWLEIPDEETGGVLGARPCPGCPDCDSARRCRSCGCTNDRACIRVDGGDDVEHCGWAESDLCTACVPDAGEGWLHPNEQAVR